MADIEVNYKGSIIATTSATGTKTLLTSGKYCEDDIEINYIKPSSSYITIKSYEGSLLTCDLQTYQLQSGETEHSFLVDLGTHTITSTYNGNVASDTVLVDVSGIYSTYLYPSQLPTAYQEVEYIRSTGTQYINTNTLITQMDKIKFNFALNSYTFNRTNPELLGANDNTSSNFFQIFILNTGKIGYTTTRTDDTINNYTFSTDVIYKIEFNFEQNAQSLMINNNLISGSTKAIAQITNPLLIFDRTALNVRTAYDLYRFKMYNSDVLIKDLVPCYRKSDNKPGLYDLVNDVFYTNQGTGEFIVGGNV